MLLTTEVRYESKSFGEIQLPVFIELIEPNANLTEENKYKANGIIERISFNIFGISYENIVSLVDSYYEVIGVKNPHKDSLDAVKRL